jgi:hypothetical protein
MIKTISSKCRSKESSQRYLEILNPRTEDHVSRKERKDAKFGVLFKRFLSDANLKLCALAPWRDKIRIRQKIISRKDAKSPRSDFYLIKGFLSDEKL